MSRRIIEIQLPYKGLEMGDNIVIIITTVQLRSYLPTKKVPETPGLWRMFLWNYVWILHFRFDVRILVPFMAAIAGRLHIELLVLMTVAAVE